MRILEIISEIEASPEPSRHLDAGIALAVGYKKTIENVGTDSSEGIKPKVKWTDPKGKAVASIPYYTLDLNHAYMLAIQVAPDMAAGCSWEKDEGNARIDNGPYCKAPTPAMALCLAALRHVQDKK
ncbi:hypothetical protein HAAEEKHM_00026 [Sinorhizobium phage AP-16-3]|nr:hypothetical protein HAAEEKHM_00026 [Sinorhizobium phage AP-16-3]